MTVKRRKTNDEGHVEVVEEEIKNPWLRIILGTNGWRLVIILLIASMHPLGRSFLAGFGFEFQDTRKISVAAENANAAKSELTQISDLVKEMAKDISSIKANDAIQNNKLDGIGERQTALETKFSGFQIDFSKWKPNHEPKQP